MKTNLFFGLSLIAHFVALCACLADDGSARRYADFLGNDELALSFGLLARTDVQRELKMTAMQVAKVKHAASATARKIPGMTELLEDYRKKKSDPTLSASDKVTLAKALLSDVRTRSEAYQRNELSATLSADQRQRLAELVVQMHGPIAVVDNPAISSKLQLSKKQKAELDDTVKNYEPGLGWLRARYGRQQISGFRDPETQEDRRQEVEALFVVIRATERARDRDLLIELTPDQLASWRKSIGKPFPIAWPQSSFSDILGASAPEK